MSSGFTRPFSLLLKPAGADCNLACAYCFYLPKHALYPQAPHPRMNDVVLEAVVRSYLATDQPLYAFCWQGGEPLLMGQSFYERVTDLQQRHARPGSLIANSVQTNALLVDDDLARHFARYRFLVGCSLDGPPEIHDAQRRGRGGASSHIAAWRGLEILRRHGVAVNVLSLVTQANVGRARELYGYFRERGLLHQQYIPCVEFDAGGLPRSFAITGAQWGDFLCDLFDAWFADGLGEVSIRLFEALLGRLVTGEVTLCHLGSRCDQYLVIEHNGDIYPCDFFVEPGLWLGNVQGDGEPQGEIAPAAGGGLTAALDSQRYRAFSERKTPSDPACANCACRPLCEGDCPKYRQTGVDETHQPGSAPPETRRSILCEGWRQFHTHAGERLASLAARVIAARSDQLGGGSP